MRLNDIPATTLAKDTKTSVRGLHEDLGHIQERISDCGYSDWREDWRGWVPDDSCSCKRCQRARVEF